MTHQTDGGFNGSIYSQFYKIGQALDALNGDAAIGGPMALASYVAYPELLRPSIENTLRDIDTFIVNAIAFFGQTGQDDESVTVASLRDSFLQVLGHFIPVATTTTTVPNDDDDGDEEDDESEETPEENIVPDIEDLLPRCNGCPSRGNCTQATNGRQNGPNAGQPRGGRIMVTYESQ